MLTNQTLNNATKNSICLETSADFSYFTKKKIDDKYTVLTTPKSYKSLTVVISQYIHSECVFAKRDKMLKQGENRCLKKIKKDCREYK